MKHKFLLLATTLAIHSAALAETKVPSLINYQGYVATSAGVAIGAGSSVNRTVTFRFWKSATDTAAASRLYSETQTVTILNGDFSVLIGSGAAVVGEANSAATVAAVFANKEVFLGITVDDGNTATTDAEVTPRQQLVSTAFAFRASVAESVDDGVISNTMLAPNAVDTTQIAGSAVTAEKIAASAVGSSQVADGSIVTADIATDTILANDIAAGAVGTSEILDGTIATADIANLAVTTAKIATDTILAGNIAAGAVGTSEILDGTVASADIADGTIATADIANLAVTTAKIATDTILAGNIAAGAVGTSEIADGSVMVTDLNFKPATGDENLRIIRGTVNAAGGVAYGSGFSVYRVAGGMYRISFNTQFSGSPSITTSITGRFGLTAFVVDPNRGTYPPNGTDALYPTAGGFDVTVLDSTAVNAYNFGFHFIAVGPR